ncbi:MAG: homoserine O-acetyltransferase [bacterium]|nr:homoserine O-acetyltransferase [bacterium]
MGTGSVGTVRTEYYSFAEPPGELVLESGERLGPVTIAYETYGSLDAARGNAVLILHALSGDAHAAGLHADGGARPGWWDNMIGPGKAFDTDRYFVICSNVLGGCMGSTGPSSVNPATGGPYALDFPFITIADMVRAQKALIDHLGIRELLAVAGGSMGGMQVLEWATAYPEMVRAAIPIATTSHLSAQGIAFNEVGRRAIMSDPAWKGGNYYGGEPPRNGLALARMIGHITYLSDEAMHRKFGRRLHDRKELSYEFLTDFQVESYLHHQGDAFTQRFDANAYLYITKAIDYFDLSEKGGGSLVRACAGVRASFLIISFSSDWLYPPYQNKEIADALRVGGAEVSFVVLDSSYGHDAFLLEAEQQTRLISHFLRHVHEDHAPGGAHR